MFPFNKVIIYQYGKVGSSTIEGALKPIINDKLFDTQKERIDLAYGIHTHRHDVAEYFLDNYKNLLIINIVRFPIERNLSAFWQNYKKNIPDFQNKSIEEINTIFKNKYTFNPQDWMMTLFDILEINLDSFKFNFENKFTEMKKNGNTYLFIRFEDLEFVINNVLPNYGINISENKNISSEKIYSEKYNKHKLFYTIDEDYENELKNNIIINKFYRKDEIEKYIKKFKTNNF